MSVLQCNIQYYKMLLMMTDRPAEFQPFLHPRQFLLHGVHEYLVFFTGLVEDYIDFDTICRGYRLKQLDSISLDIPLTLVIAAPLQRTMSYFA